MRRDRGRHLSEIGDRVWGCSNGIGELAYKPLRVVVLSNYATAEMRRRCTDLGADEVFDKSSEIDELLAWFNNQQVTQ
jgi:CheY-like chemotaxis protein